MGAAEIVRIFFKENVCVLLLLPFFFGGSLFAASSPSSKKEGTDPPLNQEADFPEEHLEFLSLGEYWGVRTDIDAAQGGVGERQIIDLQYDWDSALSASKEAEGFAQAEQQEKEIEPKKGY